MTGPVIETTQSTKWSHVALAWKNETTLKMNPKFVPRVNKDRPRFRKWKTELASATCHHNDRQHKDEGAIDGDQLRITHPWMLSMDRTRPKKTIYIILPLTMR